MDPRFSLEIDLVRLPSLDANDPPASGRAFSASITRFIEGQMFSDTRLFIVLVITNRNESEVSQIFELEADPNNRVYRQIGIGHATLADWLCGEKPSKRQAQQILPDLKKTIVRAAMQNGWL